MSNYAENKGAEAGKDQRRPEAGPGWSAGGAGCSASGQRPAAGGPGRRSGRKRTEAGFSLVEVIIALAILLMALLAMMQSAMVSISANAKNVVRDEAVTVAEEEINEARSMGFANLVSSSDTVTRDLRNISGGITFIANRTVTSIGTSAKQVNVDVYWSWRGDDYNHSAMTVVKQ